MADGQESLEIIDLDDLNLEDNEETWLVSNAGGADSACSSWRKWNMSDDPEVRMKKRSLVEKLDFIAKGSPTRTFYTHRPSMSSTPLSSITAPSRVSNSPAKFDPRTFTRPNPSRNLTFDKDEEDWKNATFTRPKRYSRESSEALDDDRLSLASSDTSSSHRLNDVGDVQNLARLQEESLRETLGLNSTFTKRGSLNTTYQKSNNHDATYELIRGTSDKVKDSRSSSQDIDLEDRLSSTSDSSMSHRLNDLGDVQHLARMQEESLRTAVMSNNHRSATVSPSSENSPSTEGGHADLEEGSYGQVGLHHHHHRNNGGAAGYAQYSSQDSLPDSPYSSQSLDSQPANGQDRIGRSMPNLNKIRGQKKAAAAAAPPNSSKVGNASHASSGHSGQINYGLSSASSRHHNSDPRMKGAYTAYQQSAVPSRGTVVSRDSSAGSTGGVRQPLRFQSGLRPPSTSSAQSRIARPSTGIPRPGSRLPAPTASSGIPKPNSNPGSRASSASGPRKSSYCY